LARYLQEASKDLGNNDKAQYLHLYQDASSQEGWKSFQELDSHTKAHAKNGILMDDLSFTAEPTLVIGLPAGTKGSQHATNERYYVSDYDVYAVAHTSTVITGQNPRIEGWGNHGEFADPRDIKAIIAVNAQLLGQGQSIQEFEGELGSHFRDFPIQHAPCAATQVKGGGDAPLAGYAVPDFMENPPKSLWAIEPGDQNHPEGSIIELKSAEDFAAYMITKSTEDPDCPCEAILNSKVLDHCMNKLYQVQPRAAA
jgi:hypothetical protein